MSASSMWRSPRGSNGCAPDQASSSAAEARLAGDQRVDVLLQFGERSARTAGEEPRHVPAPRPGRPDPRRTGTGDLLDHLGQVSQRRRAELPCFTLQRVRGQHQCSGVAGTHRRFDLRDRLGAVLAEIAQHADRKPPPSICRAASQSGRDRPNLPPWCIPTTPGPLALWQSRAPAHDASLCAGR